MSSAKKSDLSLSQLYEKCLEEYTAVEEIHKQKQVFRFELSYLEAKAMMKEEELRTWLLDILELTETRAENLRDNPISLHAKKIVVEYMKEQKLEAEAGAKAEKMEGGREA